MKSDLLPLIREFYKYSKSRLNFPQSAKIKMLDDQENADNLLGQTGNYDPSSYTITLYITGRHPIDLLRSVSHELVHHWQNCNGKFEGMEAIDDGYAQNNEHLRKMESEAYEKGNLILRDWQDMKRKESKNENSPISLQEAYNIKARAVGYCLLTETKGYKQPIKEVQTEPSRDLNWQIAQGIKAQIRKGEPNEDIIMWAMLHNRGLTREGAVKLLKQAFANMKLEENLDDEYKIGNSEEMEHDVNKAGAHKIATDHLKSDKRYYSKLKACGLVDAEEGDK